MSLIFKLPLLAQAVVPLFDELGIAGAILLTVAGMLLHLYQPRHRMSMEERVKDSKMVEEEARRQIRFYQLCAPTVTLVGIALLTLAIYDMSV